MSINKFGGGGIKDRKNNDTFNRIDKKFIILSNSKIDKCGDIMTGNLQFKFADTTNHLQLGILDDLQPYQSFTFMLGGPNNQFCVSHDRKVKFSTLKGFEISNHIGKSAQFGDQNDSLIRFYSKVLMKDQYIAELHDPKSLQDAATKNYVDTRYVKNNVGLVPHLVNNVSKNGFVISVYTINGETINNSMVFRVFNSSGAEWSMPTITDSDIYFQIQCPFPVKIHRFALKGRRSGLDQYTNWEIQGSVDTLKWNIIYTSILPIEYVKPGFYNLDSITPEYSYFRLKIPSSGSSGTTVGLSYFQLYSADPIVT